MAKSSKSRVWQGSDAYEAYMGRWSRPIAKAFLSWFDASNAGDWLDVGCGTGALTASILDDADPNAVTGIDPSIDFLTTAKTLVSDPRAHFVVGDATVLPVVSTGFDAVVAGLVLNHLSDPALGVMEMVRATKFGGSVGAYVWDYIGEMQMIRIFWEAVAATNPEAMSHDPRLHYRICQPDVLDSVLRTAGLDEVRVEAIDLPMRFQDVDDFWRPHTMIGPSAVQRFVTTLQDKQRVVLKEQLQATLPIAADGTIDLIGRAWMARGTKTAAGSPR